MSKPPRLARAPPTQGPPPRPLAHTDQRCRFWVTFPDLLYVIRRTDRRTNNRFFLRPFLALTALAAAFFTFWFIEPGMRRLDAQPLFIVGIATFIGAAAWSLLPLFRAASKHRQHLALSANTCGACAYPLPSLTQPDHTTLCPECGAAWLRDDA